MDAPAQPAASHETRRLREKILEFFVNVRYNRDLDNQRSLHGPRRAGGGDAKIAGRTLSFPIGAMDG